MTEMHTEKLFDEIRPYNDDEVAPVVKRLMADREMVDTLLAMKYPLAEKYIGWLLRPLVRKKLRKAFGRIHTVRDLQALISGYMKSMLSQSNSTLTVSGAENLDLHGAYLFMSNHRDIAMDPAYVGLAIHEQGMDTVRIAIGDNLLTKPFASDLMRLNKSFIVKRSATGRREKLRALTTLSKYIRHSLNVDHSNIWIAQREGRAKDGIDRTEPALIKMLSLSKSKGQTIGEAILQLNIVPVTISYRLDPCDLDKARELNIRASSGSYQKSAHEDLESMNKGIMGVKGRVHVAFGKPLCSDFANADEIAKAIDEQIISNYQLHTTNLIAWEMLNGPDPRVSALKAAMTDDFTGIEELLMARVSGESDQVRNIFLSMYANPVQSLFDLQEKFLMETGVNIDTAE